MGTRLFLLLSVLLTAQPILMDAPPEGRSLTDAEARAAIGGINGIGSTTLDAKCYLNQQCILPLNNLLCNDFTSGGCSEARQTVDTNPADFPVGCGMDAPGEICTLSSPFNCATIHFCYENPYTTKCELDPGRILRHITGASSCQEDSN